ncbi:MAG: BamA/TamA family outer membrane protein [Cytophagales bacterium]|nr:BamA/TamA family outer membrane protein [Cytophagales bacterium]
MTLNKFATPARAMPRLLAGLCAIALFPGCVNTKHLKEHEYLLYKQSIKGNKDIDIESLEIFLRQKPNHKILGWTAYLNLYYYGTKIYDTTAIKEVNEKVNSKYEKKLALTPDTLGKDQKKREQSPARHAKALRTAGGKVDKLNKKHKKKTDKLNLKLQAGNWLMRSVGEPPVVFDSASADESVKHIRLYLKSVGYFQGNAIYSVKTKRKKIKLTYHITENTPHYLAAITYHTNDSIIESIITSDIKNSLLKTGDNYDEEKLSSERARIEKLIKNNGYFSFSRQYVFFEIDTSDGVKVKVLIKDPPKGQKHKVFTLDEVNFTTIENPSEKTGQIRSDTLTYNNIHYKVSRDLFSKKILNNKIKIYPGEKYSLYNTIQTQRQLANLDMFKFININYDTTNNRFVANIFTRPFEKYQITDELGVSVNVGQGQGLPGPFGYITFKDRNIFNNYEIFEATIRGGIEGQASILDPEQVYKSYDLGANVSLTFPQILIPTKIRYKFPEFNHKTRLSLGYNFVDRQDYKRTNLKTTMNYIWQKGAFKLTTISPFELSLVRTRDIDSTFQAYLVGLSNKGNNLQLSFGRSLVSSFNAAYQFNNNEFGVNKKSRFFRIYAESGGTVFNLLDKSFLEKNDSIFNLRFFRYLKLQTDLRYYRPITSKSSVAMRFNGGIARPYDRKKVLPYEKYFFTGGSSSNRAWKPRRLGPGSFIPLLDGNPDYRYLFEQPGEIILETNFEYRFNIAGFIDGALFVDAGNVWTIEEDNSRPGSEFDIESFYKQIAVGSGFGLRFDFVFLIIRLDVGIKTWDPARPPEERLAIKKISFRKPDDEHRERVQPVFNIGIGYPF